MKESESVTGEIIPDTQTIDIPTSRISSALFAALRKLAVDAEWEVARCGDSHCEWRGECAHYRVNAEGRLCRE